MYFTTSRVTSRPCDMLGFYVALVSRIDNCEMLVVLAHERTDKLYDIRVTETEKDHHFSRHFLRPNKFQLQFQLHATKSRKPKLAVRYTPENCTQCTPVSPFSVSLRHLLYLAFIIMKRPTALVIRSSTAFTLLFCRSLVENEAEKAKSDRDTLSLFLRLCLILLQCACHIANLACLGNELNMVHSSRGLI